jgi:exopolyphosphatase/guanosine-5'-triphosphate,3'-diphosphate pyrophosphatase
MAVLLNQKRRDDLTPDIQLQANAEQLTLLLSEEWYLQHSVLAADLAAEQQYLRRMELQLICPGLPQDSIEELT